MKRCISLIILIFVVFASISLAGSGRFKVSVIDEYEIPELEDINLSNVNGDINIRTYRGNKVTVDILIRGKSRDDLTEEEIVDEVLKIRTTDRRFSIRVNKIEEDRSLFRLFDRKYPEVEMNIKIPEGKYDYGVKTVNGSVEGIELNGEMKVSTTNGGIDLTDCNGSLIANTTNGDIDAVIEELTDDVDMETVNGSLSITLSSKFEGRVRANTVNGNISNDWGWSVDKGWGPKSLNAREGDGKYTVVLETVNGSISINK